MTRSGPTRPALGVTIDDVRIRRTDLTQEVSQQTYERMKAERLAEAERLRARGQVAAREIRAAADREVMETVATARKDSEIIKGEGDAERGKVFADAYQVDPEFFDFYRSMQAYRTALENSGTTMVLSPDSEFFRYFKKEGGQVPAGATSGSSSGAAAPASATPPADQSSAADPAASNAGGNAQAADTRAAPDETTTSSSSQSDPAVNAPANAADPATSAGQAPASTAAGQTAAPSATTVQ